MKTNPENPSGLAAEKEGPVKLHSLQPRLLRVAGLLLVLAAIVVVTVIVLRKRSKANAAPPVALEAVARRDIALTVEATGTVEPIEIIEIKSKASGQILQMPVQIGSVVKAGDLLAQIDVVTVRNQYNQSRAALAAAQAGVDVTQAQKQRADDLFGRQIMTADQHESAVLGYANAQSQLARAKSDVDIARQALNDATVRAPEAGTVIEQTVTKGQVIASATSSASGGTSLLKMADLNKVQMNALVGETDIGNVKPGQMATVTVDAFPNRPFRGEVIKIEPQAVIQQSVTMFPVLISIRNENGALLPGMNGAVTIGIASETDVLAVPVDAVRSARELPAVAIGLGLNADSISAQVQRQVAARMAARAATAPGDSARAGRRGAGGWRGAADGARGAADGARGAGGARTGRRGGMRGGGVDASATAGGAQGGAAAGGGAAGGGAFPGGGGRMGQAQVVLVETPRGLEPRIVRLGISDFDYAQVIEGLQEGDRVALLSVVEQQSKRQQDQARIQQRMGSGLPGVTATPGAGGRGAGGGR